jgi:ribosomal protein S18 acetylase RimI-like enzyme
MESYYISTKNLILYKETIWSLLTTCFWSKNIPIEYVERFLNYSLCFGVYRENNQLVGFGRVISDFTTYAYVCDVIIDPNHRNKGLGDKLISAIMNHPELQGLKTWSLRTTEQARRIYEKNGFTIIDNHTTQLEINDLDLYSRSRFVNRHL